jgi:hypothetical protein
MDKKAFERGWRHVTEPVEVVSYGQLVGIYFPIRPIVKRARAVSLEAGEWSGQRAPKRGTAAYRRMKPYLDALDEAEGNERALLKAAHDYRKPEE